MAGSSRSVLSSRVGGGPTSRDQHRPAVGDLRRRRRSAARGRAACGRESSSWSSGWRSRPRPPPSGRRGRSGTRWPPRRPRSAGSAGRTAPPPAVIRSITTSRSSSPGMHQLGVTARRTPSPARWSPSAPARTEPPSRARRGARGRWPRSRSRPSRAPAIERPAIGLGAQRRVHLEAAVERAHEVVGERQVVRADLAADPRPGRLGGGQRLRPTPRTTRCWKCTRASS